MRKLFLNLTLTINLIVPREVYVQKNDFPSNSVITGVFENKYWGWRFSLAA